MSFKIRQLPFECNKDEKRFSVSSKFLLSRSTTIEEYGNIGLACSSGSGNGKGVQLFTDEEN